MSRKNIVTWKWIYMYMYNNYIIVQCACTDVFPDTIMNRKDVVTMVIIEHFLV